MLATYESQTVTIPKYSLMGPFRGHMSIKSSPFMPGSSSTLSSQYIVQDHMATHYRKLLSAKAAVDTSTPKTLFTSIKFKDQQKKEKLIKAVDKYKKEIQDIYSSSHHSGETFPEQWTPINKEYLHSVLKENPGTKDGQSFQGWKTIKRSQSPAQIARETMFNIQRGDYHRGFSVLPSSGLRANYRPTSNIGEKKKTYHDPEKKTYSGDLLDKHAERFTSAKQPFKPRLLKKSSQSFLSNYKYYKPPGKKNSAKQPSPKSVFESLKERHRYLEENNIQSENISRRLDSARMNPADPSKLLQQEEDLKSLQFLQDLTSDILIRSCGSTRAMEHVFQEHLQRPHPDIDWIKKKLLIRDLKDELEKNEKLDFSISYDGAQYNS
ncbi:spermatogenesis-associated protein 7 homolog [Pelobates fuscus]|uniref:spermatogenesis-associated protein 7 homolog n=1 Tax=Pelobates fuscus TaxID=191477 RepID=UPI002FE4B70C